MINHSDILIIGAGVIGSACAWFTSDLAAKVTIIDPKEPGCGGSSAISRGLLRVYEPQQALVPWAAQGVGFYQNWPDAELGNNPTCQQGILYRLAPENIAYAKAFVNQFNCPSYPIELVKFSQLKAGFSELSQLSWNNDDWVIYEPNGGYGDPTLTSQRFVEAASQKNCQVVQQAVTSFHRQDNGLWLVETDQGQWQTRTLVVAAGAYCTDWFADLQMRTRTIAIPKFKAKQALLLPIIDEIETCYMRPLANGEFIAGSQVYNYGHWSDWDNQASQEQINDSQQRVDRLMQQAKPTAGQDKTLGFDGYTTDFMPIMETDYQQPGCILLTGFSGRGYKMAPAIGQWLAAILVEQYGYVVKLSVPTSSYAELV